MNKIMKVIMALIVVAIIAGGAVWAMNKKDKDDTTNTPANSSNSTNTGNQNPSNTNDTSANSANSANQAATVTITYLGDAFELSKTTVSVGSTIKVVNQSQKQLDFNSDPHPVHTDEPEFNLGAIASGASKTFTVTKKGTWGFHNHLNPNQHAKITVE